MHVKPVMASYYLQSSPVESGGLHTVHRISQEFHIQTFFYCGHAQDDDGVMPVVEGIVD